MYSCFSGIELSTRSGTCGCIRGKLAAIKGSDAPMPDSTATACRQAIRSWWWRGPSSCRELAQTWFCYHKRPFGHLTFLCRACARYNCWSFPSQYAAAVSNSERLWVRADPHQCGGNWVRKILPPGQFLFSGGEEQAPDNADVKMEEAPPPKK